MTRPILAVLVAISIAGLTGCDARDVTGQMSGPPKSGWTTAPVVQSVARTSDGMVIRGQASPSARIVLRGDGDLAYAVGADERGMFDIRIRPPTTDSLFVVETQVGEERAPAPNRLLVSRDPAGPVALITPGAPTLRLDPGLGLDVIDSDGRTHIASGRAAAGSRVVVTVNDQKRNVIADSQGRWILDLGPDASLPLRLSISGATYTYSIDDDDGDAGAMLTSRAGGRQLRWSLSPTSSQTSWFPDRPR